MKHLFLTSSFNVVAEAVSNQVKEVATGSKVLFVQTAAETYPGSKSWLEEDVMALKKQGFSVERFSVTDQTREACEAAFNEADILFFAGGNTYYLLQQIQKLHLEEMIRTLVEAGIVYVGSSAGSVLAGPKVDIADLDDPAEAPDLQNRLSLGLTTVQILPHWGNPDFQKEYTAALQELYTVPGGYLLLNDTQYLYQKDEWWQVISV